MSRVAARRGRRRGRRRRLPVCPHRPELDLIDERRRVAEHGRDPRTQRDGIGGSRSRPLNGRGRLEELIQPLTDVRRHKFHAAADVGGCAVRLALDGVLKRPHRRRIGIQRDGAQRQHRQQQERDDEASTERQIQKDGKRKTENGKGKRKSSIVA